MKNYFDIKDKVAVITGESSGLGFQIGKAYADQGAKVVLLARREERLKENDAEGIFQKLVNEERINVFLSENDFKVFFTATDVFSSVFLFFDENHFDDGEMLLAEDYIDDSMALFDSYRDLLE